MKEISDNEIVIDSYIIKGTFLKIKKMDSYMLEIKGKISCIELKDISD